MVERKKGDYTHIDEWLEENADFNKVSEIFYKELKNGKTANEALVNTLFQVAKSTAEKTSPNGKVKGVFKGGEAPAHSSYYEKTPMINKVSEDDTVEDLKTASEEWGGVFNQPWFYKKVNSEGLYGLEQETREKSIEKLESSGVLEGLSSKERESFINASVENFKKTGKYMS